MADLSLKKNDKMKLDAVHDFHDAEIYKIEFDKTINMLSISMQLENKIKITIWFDNTVYFDLLPFSQQNAIYELEFFSGSTVPQYLYNEYENLSSVVKDNDSVAYINPSIGLGGIIVYEKLKWK